MTLAEFFSCSLLAFGPPIAMFALTIANDPIRIIIMIAAAFGWLLSFLVSSLIWYAVVPLRTYLAFGMVFAIIIQVSLYNKKSVSRRTQQDRQRKHSVETLFPTLFIYLISQHNFDHLEIYNKHYLNINN